MTAGTQEEKPKPSTWTIVFAVGVAVLAAGAAMLMLIRHLQVRYATDEVRAIQDVAEQYRAAHSGACVTYSQLRTAVDLHDMMPLADPWGSEYVVRCSDTRATASSLGPDKAEGTADDIRVPLGR